jgi:hypothetical protein
MIKLGVFGDQTTDQTLMTRIKSTPGVVISGVHFSGNVAFPDTVPEVASPEGLMDISDALLILGQNSISSDLIRLILRKSKHLFLETVPNLNVRDIKELTDMEKEAGSRIVIYNPFHYISWLNPELTSYEKPFLVNLSTTPESTLIKPAHELLLLVTAFNRLTQSGYKKLDVFGMKDNDGQLVIHLRLEYDNGCVVNITLSQARAGGRCELFAPSGMSRFEFEKPLSVLHPQLNQEVAAIGDFVRDIGVQAPANPVSHSTLNDLKILEEIRVHLRFKEIVF